MEPTQKYSKDGDFKEPVVICDACTKLIIVSELKKIGMCPHCSNTRVRNVRIMTEENMEIAKKWAAEGKIDPDWLKLFEGVDVTNAISGGNA